MSDQVSVSAASPHAPDQSGTYPCQAMRNQEVVFATCQGTTTMPARNEIYCKDCACKWRHCNSCLIQGNTEDPWVVDPVTGLCDFHKTHGKDAERKKLPAPRMELSIRYAKRDNLEIDIDIDPARKPPKPPKKSGKGGKRGGKRKAFVGRGEITPKDLSLVEVRSTPELLRMARLIPNFTGKKARILELVGLGYANAEIGVETDTSIVNVGVTVSGLLTDLKVPKFDTEPLKQSSIRRREMMIDAYRLHLKDSK
jgi:hypothetical protein